MHRSSLPPTSSDEHPPVVNVVTTPVTAAAIDGRPVGRSRRRHGRLAALGVIAVTLAILGVSCTKNAQAFQSVQLTNAERGARGMRGLTIDDTLVEKAQAWAEHMAAVGGISHSVLTDGAGRNWRTLGENVGVAGSVEQVNALFMNSAPHRANILNGAYARIGTGVAQAGGRYYVAQVFAG